SDDPLNPVAGALDTDVDLPVTVAGDGTVTPSALTFEQTLVPLPGFTGTLTNSAAVTAPAGATDADTADNSAADVDTTAPKQAGITIIKSAGLREVGRGAQVPYTIQATNNNPTFSTTVTIFDKIPSGFRYVPGTGSVNGVSIDPTIEGRVISFADMTLEPEQTIKIQLRLLVLSTVSPGLHRNFANALDQDGNAVGSDAVAEVIVVGEHVFDCGDVIGKVFDDANRNGYQDKSERGLPGVRIATVKGLLVTTDKHGRYNVSCADLPDHRVGTNFIMKLDTRTLPAGYRLTTENPRVVRLTAGKTTKLDFGAAIGRVVRLDLKDEAFEPGRVELRQRWRSSLNQLIDVLREEQSILRLSYVDAGTNYDLAVMRLRRLEKEITRLWKVVNRRYRLEIETRVETGR
ncbi:MAG: DUF11 domain-containing protein, partial [Roseibium sp.]|nr:DUF11 domain-containing protein [Roseibium sp.]